MSTVPEIQKNADQRMQKSLEALKTGLAKLRTGRAHAGILDHVMVDYYGNPTPTGQVANVSLLDARTISVQPWEKGMAAKIEKAIRESDLGLNPSNDGVVIRLSFPALTEERRKDFVKIVRTKAEEGKVAGRGVRRHARQELDGLEKEKENGISTDDIKRVETILDKMTQDEVAAIDSLLSHKEQELLEV